MNLIKCWLASETEKLDRFVRRLWQLELQDIARFGLVNTMVTESATSIVLARTRIQEEIAFITTEWNKRNA